VTLTSLFWQLGESILGLPNDNTRENALNLHQSLMTFRAVGRRGNDIKTVIQEVRNHVAANGGGDKYWGGDVQREVDSKLQALNQMRVSCSLLANTLALWLEANKLGCAPSLQHPFFHSGVVHSALKLKTLVNVTVSDVGEVFHEEIGLMPEVGTHFGGFAEDQRSPECTYIPSHIQYILQEMLKNAIVLDVERQRQLGGLPAVREGGDAPPGTRLEVLRHGDELCLVVADTGEGLPTPHVWSYGYSSWMDTPDGTAQGEHGEALHGEWYKMRERTSTEREGAEDRPQHYPVWHKRLAGGGVGLPMLKMYAELFGGLTGELEDLPEHFRILSATEFGANSFTNSFEAASPTQNGVFVVVPVGDDARESEIRAWVPEV